MLKQMKPVKTEGTAFAALNEATQKGLESLRPYEELGGKALKGLVKRILSFRLRKEQ